MRKRNQGFTLIELLVTSTIIIVLATIGFVSYTSAVVGSRDGKRKADMATLQQSLVLFKQENPTYPSSGYAALVAAGGPLLSGGFISQPTPDDPKTPGSYTYTQTGSGTGFCLCANTENDTKNANSNSACNFSAGTKTHYCLTNP